MVTTENAFTTVAPVKAIEVIPAKVAKPAAAAAGVAAKVLTKKVAKPSAPKTKTLPRKAVVKAPAKPAIKVSPPKPVVNAPIKPAVKASAKPKAGKSVKEKKAKLIRDSFTIPKAEHKVLGELKQRAGKLAVPVKKSDLLRAGIKALVAMADAVFLAALKALPVIKNRPLRKGG